MKCDVGQACLDRLVSTRGVTSAAMSARGSRSSKLTGTAAGSSSAALGAAPACAGGLRAPLRRTMRVGTTCMWGTSLRHTDLK